MSDSMNDSMVSLELVCKMAELDPDEFRVVFDNYGFKWNGHEDLRYQLYRHLVEKGETISGIRHRLHDWGIQKLTNSLTTTPQSLPHPFLTPPPSPTPLVKVIYDMAKECPEEFLTAFDRYGCKWDGCKDLRQLLYYHLDSRGETLRLVTRRCQEWGLRTLFRFLCMQQY